MKRKFLVTILSMMGLILRSQNQDLPFFLSVDSTEVLDNIPRDFLKEIRRQSNIKFKNRGFLKRRGNFRSAELIIRNKEYCGLYYVHGKVGEHGHFIIYSRITKTIVSTFLCIGHFHSLVDLQLNWDKQCIGSPGDTDCVW